MSSIIIRSRRQTSLELIFELIGRIFFKQCPDCIGFGEIVREEFDPNYNGIGFVKKVLISYPCKCNGSGKVWRFKYGAN